MPNPGKNDSFFVMSAILQYGMFSIFPYPSGFFQACLMLFIDVYSHVLSHGGFLSHGDTPSHHPFFRMDFP